jgi:opacity protein-like surface antigen
MKKITALSLPRYSVEAMGLLFFNALLCFTPVHGAETPARPGVSYALAKGANEFGLWAGGSPDSSSFIGHAEDRNLFIFALRYGRVFAAWESLTLEYTLDIVPAAVVFEPDRVRRGRSTIYGAGLSPLGIKINFAQESWIKPFLAASVGFLYFQEDVPVPRSSRFNFTPEIGLGVQFFLTPKRAVTLGYKLHHMSNANTGRSNPGMDSHVIYAGVSFFTP